MKERFPAQRDVHPRQREDHHDQRKIPIVLNIPLFLEMLDHAHRLTPKVDIKKYVPMPKTNAAVIPKT